jgi:hypothetical protein
VSRVDLLPPRVALAQARLHAGPLYFAPIRHHSPACALALQSMLDELEPARLLVEGPAGLQPLLPLLRDPACRPPVAVLIQNEGGNSGYFPFCDYSPEWVALRWQGRSECKLQFIDLPWSDRAGHDRSEEGGRAASLLQERHLAHSQYLAELARRAGCRDHDELWEHWFELREATELRDWRTYFAEVHAWCAMARLDYSDAELAAEGNLAREARMLEWLQALPDDGRATVVLTGGFHTLALIEGLAVSGKRLKQARRSEDRDGCWLIRYSFDRLDALNGYAAGMPAPAWQQSLWQAWQRNEVQPWRGVALSHLLRFARRQRSSGVEGMSSADLQAALLQAERLAQLRGHPGPGRVDLLDAARSCLLKSAFDEGGERLLLELQIELAGNALGDVPASAGSPPLLERARAEARALGFKLDDTQPRQTELDLYRKPRHRARSRYLQRMNFLDVGLAQWQAGPDFVHGVDLGRLKEHWRYAWTPQVEARLIELSGDGARLEEVALNRLLAAEAELEAAGQGRSAAAAVSLLLRGCVLGLHSALPRLCALVSRQLQADPALPSLAQACSGLLGLRRGRTVLDLAQLPVDVEASMHALWIEAWQACLLQVPNLHAVEASREDEHIDALLSLRGCARAIGREDASAAAAWHARLRELAERSHCAAGIAAVAGAILQLDDPDLARDGSHLATQIERHFGTGAQVGAAVRYLRGLLRAAPELMLRADALALALDRCLARWDETEFLAHLPDLRQAFSALKPFESEALARQLAEHHGVGVDLSQGSDAFTIEDVGEGMAVDAQLRAWLRAAGLQGWLAESTAQEAST